MRNRKEQVREVLERVKRDGRKALTAPECAAVCAAYGIPLPQEGLATSPDQAAHVGAKIGYPVVMKIVSADILHKTEAGGVVVGVKSAEEARAAYESITRNAKAYKKDATVDGVQIQKLVEKQ